MAWQLVFFVIARDPARFRPLMIPSVVEKVTLGEFRRRCWCCRGGRVKQRFGVRGDGYGAGDFDCGGVCGDREGVGWGKWKIENRKRVVLTEETETSRAHAVGFGGPYVGPGGPSLGTRRTQEALERRTQATLA